MKGRPIGVSVRRASRVLLLVAVVLPCVGYGCADRLVLGENHETIDAGGAERRVIQVEGRAVECWVARSPGARDDGPRAFVLYFTGKGDRADRWVVPVADSWGDRPVELWGMNYPGSGGSQGPVSLGQVAPAAVGAYDALRQVAGDRPIFVQAGSFGTTAALCVAARRPVAGAVLANPPPLRQLVLGSYGWWNLWLLAGPVSMALPPELDSLANAAKAQAPAVFLSAANDEVVPARYHRMVIDAYVGPKQVISRPGARHDDPLSREAAEELAREIDGLWTRAGLPGGNAAPARR